MKINLFSRNAMRHFISIFMFFILTSIVFFNCKKPIYSSIEELKKLNYDTLVLNVGNGQYQFFTISGEYILLKNHPNYSKNRTFLINSKFTQQHCSNCGPHLERWKFPGNPRDTMPMPAPPPRPNPFPFPYGIFANPGIR